MTPRLGAAALAALAAVMGIGCAPSQPCDPGQMLVGSLCYPAPVAPDAGGSGDAGSDAGTSSDAGSDAGADGGLCQDKYAGFGAACTSVSQCTCATDYCIAFAGFDYCSRKDCLADATLCPQGWACNDLSAYGQPSVCFKP
jgi:hypothetical protein